MGTSTRSAPGRSDRRRPRSISAAPLGEPLLLLNLKSYPSALGRGADRLARDLERLGRDHGVAVALAPALPELRHLAARRSLAVLGQHVDPIDAGARTGSIVAEALAAAGARGSLINHSERKLPPTEVDAAVARLRDLGLASVVCAATVAEARRLARSRPDYLAIEPPELIGGDRSVSTARPELIADAVRTVHRISPGTRVLCGAGVHDRNDVRIALKLGSSGILVASAVTRSPHPGRAIEELLAGFPKARRAPKPLSSGRSHRSVATPKRL